MSHRSEVERGLPAGRASLLLAIASVIAALTGCTSARLARAPAPAGASDATVEIRPWERDCAKGDGAACFRPGLSLEKGYGVAADLSRARAAYADGCSRGFSLACTDLGYLHENGLGVA
jgi:hypothetical protein